MMNLYAFIMIIGLLGLFIFFLTLIIKYSIESQAEELEKEYESRKINTSIQGYQPIKTSHKPVKPPRKLSQWIVQSRINSVKQYEAAGFSREDAILMTLDDIQDVRKVKENLSKNKA